MNDKIKAQTRGASGPASPPALENVRVGIIGLGYVGLPLAVYMARHFPVLGFDIDKARVDELARGVDRTARGDRGGVRRRPNDLLQRRYRGSARLQFLHRHGADAGRRGQAPRSHAR